MGNEIAIEITDEILEILPSNVERDNLKALYPGFHRAALVKILPDKESEAVVADWEIY